MVPTLWGRLQTRIWLLATIGAVVTAAITPALPVHSGLSDRYRTTFVLLASVAVLGIGWELVYHFLMQFRWEKDWPSLFGLLTMLPEGAFLWALLERGAVPTLSGPPPLPAYAIHFGTVWTVVWLVANGPMRVVALRWRFRGGRVL